MSKTPPTLPDVLDEVLELYRLGIDSISDEFLTKDQAQAALLTAVRQFVVDIIGEDEEESITTLDGDDLLSGTVIDRNNLRDQQRKQLLTALGEEE